MVLEMEIGIGINLDLEISMNLMIKGHLRGICPTVITDHMVMAPHEVPQVHKDQEVRQVHMAHKTILDFEVPQTTVTLDLEIKDHHMIIPWVQEVHSSALVVPLLATPECHHPQGNRCDLMVSSKDIQIGLQVTFKVALVVLMETPGDHPQATCEVPDQDNSGMRGLPLDTHMEAPLLDIR